MAGKTMQQKSVNVEQKSINFAGHWNMLI